MLYTNLSVQSTLLEGFTANGSLGYVSDWKSAREIFLKQSNDTTDTVRLRVMTWITPTLATPTGGPQVLSAISILSIAFLPNYRPHPGTNILCARNSVNDSARRYLEHCAGSQWTAVS